MDEMLIACLQDPRHSPEFRGLTYREICGVMMSNHLATGGGATLSGIFSQLANYDIMGLAAFLNSDFAQLPDGRQMFTAVGACLDDAIPEGTVGILDDRQPIIPGDLCALAYRCGFTRQVKQYLGRWNGDYDFLTPGRPRIPGYLFYSSNPRCFIVVYGDDLVAAVRVAGFMSQDGRETECSPWSIVDHRNHADFADLFTWADIDRLAALESTPLSAWPAIREENRLLLCEWLESRMTGEDWRAFARANAHLLPGLAEQISA